MSNTESGKDRRDRHTREVEQSQQELRESISNTQRLLDQSDAVLKRHRRECEDQDD